MGHVRFSLICCLLFLTWLNLAGLAQPRSSRRPEIIRDTDVSEGTESTDNPKPKEPNPLLAEQNIKIGDFYLKKRNYDAAIQRYRTALEYQPTSVQAYEALARAYEKNGEISKAIDTYRDFIQKNPDSAKSSEFRTKLAKLEKKPS
jgi:tetratricopeptide (TPR) repeat protein